MAERPIQYGQFDRIDRPLSKWMRLYYSNFIDWIVHSQYHSLLLSLLICGRTRDNVRGCSPYREVSRVKSTRLYLSFGLNVPPIISIHIVSLASHSDYDWISNRRLLMSTKWRSIRKYLNRAKSLFTLSRIISLQPYLHHRYRIRLNNNEILRAEFIWCNITAANAE